MYVEITKFKVNLPVLIDQWTAQVKSGLLIGRRVEVVRYAWVTSQRLKVVHRCDEFQYCNLNNESSL